MLVAACRNAPHCVRQDTPGHDHGQFDLSALPRPISGTDGQRLQSQLLFVQCANCGTPVVVAESHALLHQYEHHSRLKNLEQQMASIASSLGRIGRIVGWMANQRVILARLNMGVCEVKHGA